jgi:DNA-binding NtrC family response regulator
MSKILVIDDEAAIRRSLKDILEFEKYTIDVAETGMEGLEMAKKQKYDLVLCDIKMRKMDGTEVLEKLQEEHPETAVVMISGHGTIETAVDCIRKGATDFIPKPLELNRLLICVKNALTTNDLKVETKTLKKKVKLSKGSEIIGESKAIKDILAVIDKVAPTNARVLITGNNGVGKELVARQLHEKSERANKPFVEVNCAAIPSELIESELFGHERGAFTSAVKQRIGKFEQADGGTLFLDEIGDMSASAQAKVLRVLQEGYLTRVGGDKQIKVDVRVLAATNKDLKKEIANNNFREDLYHRLSVILIHVPNLNDRKEDIPLLAKHFLDIICKDHGIATKAIAKDAIKSLQNVNWTGNIRELRNIIERLVILSDKEITTKDVTSNVNPS